MRDWTALAQQYPDRFWRLPDGRWFPILAGGGSGKTTGGSTTVVNIPGPSAEEKALQSKQVELLDLQVKEAQRQSKLLEESFPATGALLKEQLALTQELVKAIGAPETEATKEIRALSEQRALQILKGEAPAVSPESEKLINEQFASAEAEAKTQLRTFAEELATTRGLKLTDTPIGETVLREEGRIATGLAGAKASAKLDVGQSQQVFQESVRQFQENLRQQAFINRMALTGLGTPGTLAGASSALAAPIASSLGITGQRQTERMAQPTTMTRGYSAYSPGALDYYSATMQALGTAVGMYAGTKSSARFKRDIAPLDVDEYERARLKVKATPVVRFGYKWEAPEARPHLGIVIETSPEEVSRDGTTLDLPGYLGLTLAAVKGVDRRIDRLEARLPVARGRLPVRSAA